MKMPKSIWQEDNISFVVSVKNINLAYVGEINNIFKAIARPFAQPMTAIQGCSAILKHPDALKRQVTTSHHATSHTCQ